ncbi:MAG: hypothetical protein ACRCT8_05025, partial [Lacipirellulaceae bacterium]
VATGLVSLAVSDLAAVARFGVFAGVGVVVALGALFGFLAVVLHKLPAVGEAAERLAPTCREPLAANRSLVARWSAFCVGQSGPVLVSVLGGIAFAVPSIPGLRDSLLDVLPLVGVAAVLSLPRLADAIVATIVAGCTFAVALGAATTTGLWSQPTAIAAASIASGAAILLSQRYVGAFRAALDPGASCDRAATSAARLVADSSIRTALFAAALVGFACHNAGAPLDGIASCTTLGLAVAVLTAAGMAPALVVGPLRGWVAQAAETPPTAATPVEVAVLGSFEPLVIDVLPTGVEIDDAALVAADATAASDGATEPLPVTAPHFAPAPPHRVTEPKLSPASTTLRARLRRLRETAEAQRDSAERHARG